MEHNLRSYSFLTTFLIMSGVMVSRYLLGSSLFFLICKFSQIHPITEGKISLRNIREDIYWSVLSSIIFAFFSALIIKLWMFDLTKIYINIEKFPYWYLPLALLIYLIIHDAYFYWSHRILHNYFYRYHLIHHKSRIPTAWTSFSFHPLEAFSHAIFLPVMVLIIPIHWTMFFMYLVIMSLMGLTNHLGHEIYPRWLEEKLGLITATHHQKHHHRINKNYGLYFSLWDKLMGTEMNEEIR